jgi:hypothetical protein
MNLVKILVAAIASVVVIAVTTYCYFILAMRGPGPRGAGHIGVDIALFPRMLGSPVYWLVLIVIMAVLWWALLRWLFAH